MDGTCEDGLTCLSGRCDVNENSLRAAVQKNPYSVDAWDRYLLHLLANKRNKIGKKECEAALARLPRNSLIGAICGMFLMRLGDVMKAHHLLKPALEEHPARYAIQLGTAQCCTKMKDHRCVISAIRNFLKHRPRIASSRDHILLVRKANAHIGMNDCGSAMSDARRALKLKGDFAPAMAVIERCGKK